MSAAPTEHELLALCQVERDLSTWLSEHGSERGSTEFRTKLREWWGSIERLLDFHVKEVTELWGTRRTIPIQVMRMLQGSAGYLAVGKIPDHISDAAAEGRHSIGPSERRDIGLAVAYILAAKQGINHWGQTVTIADKAPVKTVCEVFGVTRTTARNWQKNIPPANLGANPVNAEIVEHLMRSAGERYRRDGRSAAAILRRGARN
jgi:hypothetical protein